MYNKNLFITKIIGINTRIVDINCVNQIRYDFSNSRYQNDKYIKNDNTINFIHSKPRINIEFFHKKSNMKFCLISFDIIITKNIQKNQLSKKSI